MGCVINTQIEYYILYSPYIDDYILHIFSCIVVTVFWNLCTLVSENGHPIPKTIIIEDYEDFKPILRKYITCFG